jgi:hypothetical protein
VILPLIYILVEIKDLGILKYFIEQRLKGSKYLKAEQPLLNGMLVQWEAYPLIGIIWRVKQVNSLREALKVTFREVKGQSKQTANEIM